MDLENMYNILEREDVKKLDGILARAQKQMIQNCQLLELNEKAVMGKAAEYHHAYHERMRFITKLLEESQPPERRRQALEIIYPARKSGPPVPDDPPEPRMPQ